MMKDLTKETTDILDKAPCGIGLFRSSDSVPIYLNDDFYSIVGFSKDDYDPRRDKGGHVTDEDRDSFIARVRSVEVGHSLCDYEYRIVSGDGTLKWVSLNMSRILLEGTDCAFISLTDISSKKKYSAEMEMIANNVGASISIIKFASDGEKLLYANDCFFQYMGVSREKYMENQAFYNNSVMNASDLKHLRETVDSLLKSGKSSGELEYRITSNDGNKYWIEQKFSLVPQLNDEFLMLSISWDITERVKSQRRDRFRQERYKLLVEQTLAAVFEWDLTEGTFECSSSFYRYEISRSDPDNILNSNASAEAVHPDDLPNIIGFFEDTLNKKSKTETVLRLKMTDGNYRWSRMLALFIRDEDGRLARIIGTITDIDTEKEKSLVMESLLNALPGGIAILTLNDFPKIQYFSDGFIKLSDWNRRDIEAECAKDTFLQQFVLEEDYPVLLTELKDAALTGRGVNITLRYKLRDGQIAWLHLTATKIREENGRPVYYAIFSRPTEETLLYKTLVDDSVTAIMVAEKISRNILFANKAWLHMEMIPEDAKVIGKNLFSVISDVVLPLTSHELNLLSETSYTEFHRFTKYNKYLSINAKAIIWNGVSSYILYITDETEELQQRQQLQNLIDHVPGGVGIYEATAGEVSLKYMNDGYYSMMEARRDDRLDYMGSNAIIPILPEDRKLIFSSIKKIFAGEQSFDFTARILNGKGKYIWVHCTGIAVNKSEEKATIYCSFSNVDAIMKLQNDLQYSRTMLSAAIKAADVNVWEISGSSLNVVQTETKRRKPSPYEKFCNIPQTLIDSGFIHKSSSAAAEELFRKSSTGVYCEAELLIKDSPASDYRWKRTICTPVYNTQGSFLKTIGTTIDINAQKERQKKYEEQLNLRKVLSRSCLGMVALNLSKNTIKERQGSSVELMKFQGSAQGLLLKMTSMIPDDSNAREFKAVFSTDAMLAAYHEESFHASIRHRLSGYRGWLESSYDLITNPYTGDIEAFCLSRDVTDDKRVELVINTLVHMDYDTIYTFDAENGVVIPFMHKEQSGDSAFHRGPDEVYSEDPLRLNDLCADDDKAAVIKENNLVYVRERLKSSPTYVTVFSVFEKGGIAHKRAMYCHLEGSGDTLLCAVQDYTESYKQEEYQKHNLEAALEKARHADAAKTDFLSNMSHEIRTPMNAIIGLAKLAEDELLTDPASVLSYLQQIGLSSGYLLGIINDILDMSRIERDKLSLRYEWISPLELLHSCTDMIAPQMKEKKISFKTLSLNTIPENLEIYTDALRAKQMLMNLLNNAYKFTPEGGTVTLETDYKSTGADDCENRLIIRDTGCGMSPDFLKRVFLPFAQERNNLTESIQGTGLGLALSKKFAEALGGDIAVSSELGKGSEFTVIYPCKYRYGHVRQQQTQLSDIAGTNLNGSRVLLAEDHPMNAVIAMKLLDKKGIKTIRAVDGQETVECFKKSAFFEFDAILMDIRMPVIGGLEAAKTIRSLDRPDAASIPIIAMTANAFESDVQNSQEAGMNAHLSKPIEPELLYKTLSEEIGRYRKNRKACE